MGIFHYKVSLVPRAYFGRRRMDMARVEQCLLLEGGSGTLLEANEELVRQRLAASHAADFVRDPAATIVRAAGELEDDR